MSGSAVPSEGLWSSALTLLLISRKGTAKASAFSRRILKERGALDERTLVQGGSACFLGADVICPI